MGRYKHPIGNCIGVVAPFGAGKSLYLLEYGLWLANEYEKQLVTNYQLDRRAVRRYCKAYGLDWFARHGMIHYVDMQDKPLIQILKYRDSVTLFDEGGIFANATEWAKVDRQFKNRYFRLRHYNIHLLIAAQYTEQIDKKFRETIQEWVIFQSLQKYDRKLRKPRLFQRTVYHFNSQCFNLWENDDRWRMHWTKPKVAALHYRSDNLWLSYLVAEFSKIITILIWLLSGCPGKLRVKDDRFQMLFSCFNSQQMSSIKLSEMPESQRQVYLASQIKSRSVSEVPGYQNGNCRILNSPQVITY